MANTCARGPLILGDFNLSISLDLSLVARITHICMHFMRKGAGASNNSCVCVYLNIFLGISISISRSIYRWWPKNTHIYACTLCAKARVPLIMCVCTRSMIPKP